MTLSRLTLVAALGLLTACIEDEEEFVTSSEFCESCDDDCDHEEADEDPDEDPDDDCEAEPDTGPLDTGDGCGES